MKKSFILLLLILITHSLFSQSRQQELYKLIDSLQYILPDTALKYCDALESDLKSDPSDNKLPIKVMTARGNIAWHKGDFRGSIKLYRQALTLSREHNERMMECNILGDIGYVFSEMGKYDSAVTYLVNSARIADELKDDRVSARVKVFMADNYSEMNKYDKAIELYHIVLAYYTKDADAHNMAALYHNMGLCYSHSGQVDSADHYLGESIARFRALKLPNELGSAYQSYSDVLYRKGDLEAALKYTLMARENFILTRNWPNVAGTRVNEASYLFKQGKLNESVAKYNEALAMGDSVVALAVKRTIYLGLSDCYKAMKQFDKAYEYHVLHAAVKDSISNETNNRMIGELEAEYENDKKESQISLQQAELKAKENEIGRQNMQKIFFAGGCVLMMLVSFMAWKAYSLKRKDNLIINTQKKMVEEKNREIMDSITYARRLQEAILPPRKLVSAILPQSFILYKPKDIVAGDFYWLERADNDVLFAAADCTGHGVPGALVSVVCSNALNRTVKEFGITKPGEILDKVRELVIETFEKSESEVKDGMDISLCALNLDDKTLTWAGANNPLWIIRNGIVLETRADKQPIGKYADTKPFTTHTLQLEAGDTIYVFTDGYADQFGGDKGKKFKYSNLKELLLSIQPQPMHKQQSILDETFEAWRGNLEQVDDVCVVGVRV